MGIKSLLFPSRLLTEGYAGRVVMAKGHSWRSVCLPVQAGAHTFQADCILLPYISLTGAGNWNSVESSDRGANALLKNQMFSGNFC